MTKRELNRDIKRLGKVFVKLYGNERTDAEFAAFKKDYRRLYYADIDAASLNAKSLRIMIRINQVYRFTSLHTFYIGIKLN